MEQFKAINGYEKYEIGDKGTVISFKQKQPRVVRQYIDSQGRYYMVDLSDGKHRKHFLVHRLVCTAFHGEPPEGMVVNHIDHDTKNNDCTNLEWVTVRENVHHSYSIMSPIRNKRRCQLITPAKDVIIFESCTDMARYCSENNLKCSHKSLIRHKKSKGYKLELI